MLANFMDAELEADVWWIITYMAYYTLLYFALKYVMQHMHPQRRQQAPSYSSASLDMKE